MNNKGFRAKIWWSLSLFVNVLLTAQAILTHNTLGCIVVILFGLYIAKFGDPIIFEKYNRQKEEQYKRACEKREHYKIMKEKSRTK